MSKPQKKRTRAEAKIATRKALIEAASEVFAERGYEAASVVELARAAGYTIGALYAHFPSKEALFFAVVHSELRAQQKLKEEALADAPTVDAEIERVVRGHFNTRTIRRSMLLMNEFWLFAARHAEHRPEFVRAFHAWQGEFVRMVVSRWVPETAKQAVSARARAAMIVALADGLARQRILSPDVATARTLIKGIRLVLGKDVD